MPARQNSINSSHFRGYLTCWIKQQLNGIYLKVNVTWFHNVLHFETSSRQIDRFLLHLFCHCMCVVLILMFLCVLRYCFVWQSSHGLYEFSHKLRKVILNQWEEWKKTRYWFRVFQCSSFSMNAEKRETILWVIEFDAQKWYCATKVYQSELLFCWHQWQANTMPSSYASHFMIYVTFILATLLIEQHHTNDPLSTNSQFFLVKMFQTNMHNAPFRCVFILIGSNSL